MTFLEIIKKKWGRILLVFDMKKNLLFLSFFLAFRHGKKMASLVFFVVVVVCCCFDDMIDDGAVVVVG